jgi:hypothetical protein
VSSLVIQNQSFKKVERGDLNRCGIGATQPKHQTTREIPSPGSARGWEKHPFANSERNLVFDRLFQVRVALWRRVLAVLECLIALRVVEEDQGPIEAL